MGTEGKVTLSVVKRLVTFSVTDTKQAPYRERG